MAQRVRLAPSSQPTIPRLAPRPNVAAALPYRRPAKASTPLFLGLGLMVVWFVLPDLDLLKLLESKKVAQAQQAEIVRVKADINTDQKKLEELLRDSEPLSDVQEAVSYLPDAPNESHPEPPPAKRRASAVQTCDADLRESVKRATGAFPNRRLIEQAHGSAHPGVATTWARVQRICNLSPGSVGAVSRDEVRRYVDACPSDALGTVTANPNVTRSHASMTALGPEGEGTGRGTYALGWTATAPALRPWPWPYLR
jgi:hypothetical protein